ncbi:TNT domain-containing protein [Streptomyces sp. HB2AG]|uniref:TNT domain-containing protein n=1 Tax=Streptomyces sp. HB2AG TaxID=2983400 RepID=UPI0022AAF437|nr:TNT domain-containing protein [Streptomyces sp. HB2AG]MCZ2525609.1 TNT domain-containing protein [Streptomyces sp. HB2AG]
MHLRRRLAVLVAGALFALGGSGTGAVAHAPSAHTAPADGTVASDCPKEDRAAPATMPLDRPPGDRDDFYRGIWQLGPDELPRRGPIGEMLRGYDRTGGMSISAFMRCYWNSDAKNWWYPKAEGFLLDDDDRPIKGKVTLRRGQYVDLFGTGEGRFLAPAGTPYRLRAIPPGNLNTYDKDYRYSYRLYKVGKSFPVDAGPVAAWFGQPGGGLQYVVNAQYFPPTPDRINIPWLLKRGYLERVN